VITHARAITLPEWAGRPVETELGGWPVVERFEPPEGDCAVGLTDLSHRPKAILQGSGVQGLGLTRPGQAVWNGRTLAGCLKPNHAVVLDLTGPIAAQWADPAYTDMTDGWVLLGLWGPDSLEAVQRLVTVDVDPRERGGPLFFARSHGQNLFEACIRAGRQFDLKVTGLRAFSDWLSGLAA
jgi:hypothetical protein